MRWKSRLPEGYKFRTYATCGSVRPSGGSSRPGRTIRFPSTGRDHQQSHPRVETACASAWGGSPPEEIAQEMEIKPRRWRKLAHRAGTVSLDSLSARRRTVNSEIFRGQRYSYPKSCGEPKAPEQLDDMLEDLTERERSFLRLRFGLKTTPTIRSRGGEAFRCHTGTHSSDRSEGVCANFGHPSGVESARFSGNERRVRWSGCHSGCSLRQHERIPYVDDPFLCYMASGSCRRRNHESGHLSQARSCEAANSGAGMIRLVAVRVDGRPVKPSGRCGRGHGFSVAFPRSLLVVEVLCDDEQLLRRKSELILYWKRVP